MSRAQATMPLAAASERSPLHELLVCLRCFNGLRASEAAGGALEDLDEHDSHRILGSAARGDVLSGQLREHRA